VLYFAYGSNMNWTQMQDRCSSARVVSIARLPDHRLAFTRRSVKRACGGADALIEAGRSVWGVVFEISGADVIALDKSEGYRPGREENSYWRSPRIVFLDGDDRRPITAEAYFAEPESDPPPPSQAYMALILSGARHWRLPDDYIAELEAIEVSG